MPLSSGTPDNKKNRMKQPPEMTAEGFAEWLSGLQDIINRMQTMALNMELLAGLIREIDERLERLQVSCCEINTIRELGDIQDHIERVIKCVNEK